MIRYDGVLTTRPADQERVLSVAIGCYTIALAREESNNLQLRTRVDAVSTIHDNTGMLVANDKKMTIGMLGYVGRHYEQNSRAYEKERRSCCPGIFRSRTKTGSPWRTSMPGYSLYKCNCEPLPPRGCWKYCA
jgi:hypothetical protein